MKFNDGKWIILLCAVVFSVVGCATSPEPSGPVTYHADHDVKYAITDIVITTNRSRDGFLEAVMLDGFGAGQHRSSIEWSVVWYDASGQRVAGASSRYRRLTVSPSVPLQMAAMAPVPNAIRAHIHVRRSRNAD
jgi:hypothetical protein